MDDITVLWWVRGGELARRMTALADELEVGGDSSNVRDAQRIREVLTCDYNPLPDRLPELGDPPLPRRVRPAERKPASEPGS